MHKGLFGARLLAVSLGIMIAGTFCTYPAQAQSSNASATAGGLRYLTPGHPPVVLASTVGAAQTTVEAAKGTHGGGSKTTTNTNLAYLGGLAGTGVETAPTVYLVLWGSQWNNNDPSGEEAILVNFLKSVGGSSWSNIDTQYCEGVATGTYTCNGAGTPAGNSIVFGGAWYDNASPAPTQPTQADFETEAENAAAVFGNISANSNANAQYIIATASGDSSVGFGTAYCSYHSYVSSTYGNIAYTDLPYITDAGAICGANFNNLGPNAGITIVEGQELTETITDPFPGYGWQDANQQEIGDKCTWLSSGHDAVSNVTFPDGQIFPVQPLWSNAYHHNKGGCVLSY